MKLSPKMDGYWQNRTQCQAAWLRTFRHAPVRLHRLLFLAIGIALALTARVQADTIVFRTGERLAGKVLAEKSSRVVFDSHAIGRIEIPHDRIDRIERETEPTPPPLAPSAVASGAVIHAPAISATFATNSFYPWVASGTNDSDWIQLKSGEWLKGRLKSLQDDKLEFDSDELDLQEFDWEDVHQVRSPRLNEILLEDRTKASGPIHITREKILVETESGPRGYERNDLVAVTPGGPREINYWSGKVSAGMTLRSGNTEQTEVNVSADLKRRTPNTRFTLDYTGNYSAIDSVESANNHRVTTQFDFWLSSRFFLKIPFAEYFKDPFQNIAHRGTVGGGVGYEIFDRPRFKWEVAVGPAYQQTWFESVQAGERDNEGNAAAVLGSLLDTKITKRVDFVSKYQLIYTREEAGGYTHHWENTFEIDLTKRLELDVSFIWDRVSHPATSGGGTTPKPDDLRTIISLGVNF